MAKNSFDPILIERYFSENYVCWWCEISEPDKKKWNRPDCLHHVLGRGAKYNNSILNAAPVNNFNCHINCHPKLKKKENITKLLQKTVAYLLENGYVFNDDDRMFVSKNRKYYLKQV